MMQAEPERQSKGPALRENRVMMSRFAGICCREDAAGTGDAFFNDE